MLLAKLHVNWAGITKQYYRKILSLTYMDCNWVRPEWLRSALKPVLSVTVGKGRAVEISLWEPENISGQRRTKKLG